jgi:protein-S-isoprenylcysteine O-methyltransferase Ste14
LAGLVIDNIPSKSSIKNLKIKNMKGLLKTSIATLVLAVTSASSFAADLTNNTQSSSLSTGAVVGGVALLIAFLVVPTIKANDKVAH